MSGGVAGSKFGHTSGAGKFLGMRQLFDHQSATSTPRQLSIVHTFLSRDIDFQSHLSQIDVSYHHFRSQITRSSSAHNQLVRLRQIHTMARQNPNIVITGTPGVGKTTHAEQLAQATGFQHVSINQIVKDEGFHEGKDEETGSWIVDEDKVCSFLRYLLNHGQIEEHTS